MNQRGLTEPQPAGIPARRPGYFLCFAKESNQRKATPMRSPLASPRGPLRCSRARAGAERTALASSLRLNGRAESVLEARCARALARCASRQRIGDPGKRSDLSQSGLFGCWLFGGPPMPSRGAQKDRPARVSAPRKQTRRGRSNAVSAANEVRSALGLAFEHHREPIAAGERRRHRGSPFSFPISLWRSKEKWVGCRGEAPAGSHEKHMPKELNSDIKKVTQ
ncbi:hypothetical protein HNQ51_002444 [Inhella inkyongensis]|uniref:Uncharacterized protein n=1 Tax=Inhella inkyongensis TaxID=392593 RepID=A0A840S434_9BURK|nr:hypothetical protein [Inhella inkyongensis]